MLCSELNGKGIQIKGIFFFLIPTNDASVDTSVDSFCCTGEINTTLGFDFFLIHTSNTSIDTSVDSLCCIGEINTTLGSFLKVGEET